MCGGCVDCVNWNLCLTQVTDAKQILKSRQPPRVAEGRVACSGVIFGGRAPLALRGELFKPPASAFSNMRTLTKEGIAHLLNRDVALPNDCVSKLLS